ncbi:MAG: hypothetical protein HYY35_05750 [Deltaproteobacteria bacterium]|nr:hypothetical protein [Deltaproteobacteria bacterium]
MGASKSEPSEGASERDLERLIETEARLAKMLAEASSEAKRIIETAQSAVQADEERTERELVDGARAPRGEMERRRAKEIDSIDSLGRARVAACDAVGAARIAELAAYVVRRVVEDQA